MKQVSAFFPMVANVRNGPTFAVNAVQAQPPRKTFAALQHTGSVYPIQTARPEAVPAKFANQQKKQGQLRRASGRIAMTIVNMS